MTGQALRGILFDLDGVLIDSGRDIMHAVNWTLQQHGLSPLPYDTVRRHIGHGAGMLLARCFAEYGSEYGAVAERALPVYKNRYLAYSVVETTLYGGVAEGLQQLCDAGFRMAIVSNKPGPLSEQILHQLGIRGHFTSLVPPEQLTHLKPDPEGLHLAMDALDVSPGEVVMVGDSWTDIAAGQRAGTRTYGALWGLGDPQAVLDMGPDGASGSFPELVDWLLDRK